MSIQDMLGQGFHVGCKVVRAVGEGYLNICTVTKIEGSKLYLDESKIAIRYPRRLLVIEQDPLYKIVKNYDLNKDV